MQHEAIRTSTDVSRYEGVRTYNSIQENAAEGGCFSQGASHLRLRNIYAAIEPVVRIRRTGHPLQHQSVSAIIPPHANTPLIGCMSFLPAFRWMGPLGP